MSESLFEKINIFYLLGIEALSKDEEQKFLRDMTQIILGSSLEEVLKKEKISADVYKKLLEILAEEKDSHKATDGIKIQRYLMDNIPNIQTYIEESSNTFKKNAFLEQLQTVQNSSESITDETDKNYLLSLINKLRTNIEFNQEEDFFNNHKLYTDLKIKYHLD